MRHKRHRLPCSLAVSGKLAAGCHISDQQRMQSAQGGLCEAQLPCRVRQARCALRQRRARGCSRWRARSGASGQEPVQVLGGPLPLGF